MPMVFYQALSLWAAAAYVKSSRPLHLVACSVAAGLSFACHQSGLATFALCGFAWVFALREGAGDRSITQRFSAGLAALVAGLGAALLLGPKTGTLAATNESAKPSTSGASGPTTTNPIDFSAQNRTTAS